MRSRFCCLANSIKHGGRCLAGIELDAGHRPVIVNGRPKWIRPVCATPLGEVPTSIAEPFGILDIIEIEVMEPRPDRHQSENVSFETRSLKTIGTFAREDLAGLYENRRSIFGNRGKAVAADAVEGLAYSLMLVNVERCHARTVTYEDRPEKPQTRLVFLYSDVEYDLPVTDPLFLFSYNLDPELFEGTPQSYLCLSLGTLHEGWYYKLVAGVVPYGTMTF